MTEHNPSNLTRRTVVAACATAGALGIAAEASAQRLPTPPRTKGPLVWLDMDQHELDEAYDQRVYAPNQPNITERRNWNSETVRAILGEPLKLSYGSAEIEKIEVYKTDRPNAPVNVYIHGGAWRGGRAAQNAFMAENFVRAGAHFAAVDFYNVGETGGDLFPMVEQCRRAVAWVYRNAADFGGDPKRLYVSGFSSGAHLAGVLLTTDWSKDFGLPADMLKGGLCISGMFDLKPVRLSSRSSYVAFTDEMEHAFSPQRHLAKLRAPLVVAYGTFETPEFQRQSCDFAAAVTAAGKRVELLVGEGYNHFELYETLATPYGLLGRAALAQMGLGAP